MRKFQAALCGLLILCGTAFSQSEKPVKVTGADAVANTSVSMQTAADGTNVLPAFGGFVFNGTTWDRMPGTTLGLTVRGGVTSGTASAISLGGVPMMCDTATSGTVTVAQAQMVRCGTGGQLSIVSSASASDGASNTIGFVESPTSNFLLMGTAPFSFNGATFDRQFYCNKVAKLSALAATTTQIVALAASQKIRVCNMSVSNNNATATTLKMVEGTGSNCATGQADVTSLWNIGATTTTPIFMHWGNDGAIITTTAADALCFTSSAASSLEITITYEQH